MSENQTDHVLFIYGKVWFDEELLDHTLWASCCPELCKRQLQSMGTNLQLFDFFFPLNVF